MPRLATVVSAITVLFVIVNLIPSSHHNTKTFEPYFHVDLWEGDEILPATTTTTTTNAVTNLTFGRIPLDVAGWNISQNSHPGDPIWTTNETTLDSTHSPSSTESNTWLRPQNSTQQSLRATSIDYKASDISAIPITTTNLSRFLQETRERLLQSASTKAWSNISTYAFGPKRMRSGYRNQIMSLTTLMMKANLEGHQQFLLDSLQHKDTYGTNEFVPFEVYFDVEHWNSFYNATQYGTHGGNTSDPGRHPISLPRLVYYDPKIHSQWDGASNGYVEAVLNGTIQEPTHPYGFLQPSTRLQMTYQRYATGKTKFVQRYDRHENHSTVNIFEQSIRNPAEILMLQGALRPNPTLQRILESLLRKMKQQANQHSPTPPNDWSYMTLHARVEPDMQRHPMCKEKKILRLDQIIRMMEDKFTSPPVSIVFMPINRQYLEKEGILPEESSNATNRNDSSINWVAVDNLRELNRITTEGLWNGTVPVVEFGANALKGTVYEHRPSTAGAILNFFLTLQPECSIFVGTEVSSFSHDVLASRFYRGYTSSRDEETPITAQYQNFKYLPEGLLDWISPGMVDSPGFLC